jgi:hypothetical protein
MAVVGSVGCVDEVQTRNGPPDEPVPLTASSPRTSSPPEAAPRPRAVPPPSPAPSPVEPTALALTRDAARAAYATHRPGDPCGTGDRWEDLLSQPVSDASRAMLRHWALDQDSTDRHVPIAALVRLDDSNLETWRRLAEDDRLQKPDSIRVVRRLLEVGGDAEVPRALGALNRPPNVVPVPDGLVTAQALLAHLRPGALSFDADPDLADLLGRRKTPMPPPPTRRP